MADTVTPTLLVIFFFADEHNVVLRPSILRTYSVEERGSYSPKLQRVEALVVILLETAALNGDLSMRQQRRTPDGQLHSTHRKKHQTTKRN